MALAVVATLLIVGPAPVAAFGGNCEAASIGQVPLSDTGDLYTSGNTMPAAHAAAAPVITPVDGVVGVVSLGMSKAREEWAAFVEMAAARDDLDPAIHFANGAVSGHTIAMWADPANDAWDSSVGFITSGGVRLDQCVWCG